MKTKDLENFESVKKMIGELSLLTRSENTKLTYLKGLKKFVEYKQIQNLDLFIQEVKEKKNQDEIFKEYALHLANKNLAPKSVAAWISALKKYFEANGLNITVDIPLKVFSIHEDNLPNKEDLKKIVQEADLRLKTIILMLASSGMRVGELHNLKMGDIDLTKEIPTIRIRAIGAKERKSRITFISKEAKKFLEEYLNQRKNLGENLNEESPVIATENGKKMSYQNLQYLLEKVFKKYSKKVGKRYSLHAHSLRKWFKTQLISAGVPAPIVDRLTGHQRYLAQEYELYTEDQLREWYEKGMKALTILE
ncbi:MAG: tyrosine-type recombinase/integrase [Candidatus Aenigmatarchaeota archaeon]|jgi:integrase/recombinase XerD